MMLQSLKNIEELSLNIPSKEEKLELWKFVEALGKIAHQMRKLEVEFYSKDIHEHEQFNLVHVIGKMKKLREFGVSGISFKTKEVLVQFGERLKALHGLKKVLWEKFEVPEGTGENFVEIVEMIAVKKGIEELVIKYRSQDKLKVYKSLDWGQVLERNPGLRFVKIESRNILTFQYGKDFEQIKFSVPRNGYIICI